MKPKINFYVLHLKHGGVESSVADWANMLCRQFDIEIISFYKFKHNMSSEMNKSIKITYLTNFTPNKESLLKHLKSFHLFKAFRESLKSLRILILRRVLVINHVKQSRAQILISTRLLYHDIISNYSSKNQIKICQEHVDHKNNSRYVNKVIRSIKNADYLIPVSKFLESSYKSFIKRAKPKVVHIQLPVKMPTDHFYVPCKKIISVGRLSPEKGFSDLVNIFNLINKKDDEWSLDIVGDGVEFELIKSKIERLRLSDKISLRGAIKREVLREYYKTSGIFVTTSFEESFGIAVVEAMSYGLPVITFDSARGINEIMYGSCAGIIVKNRDKATMAQNVINLKKEDMEKMSTCAIKLANQYDFDKISKKLNYFMKEALNGNT